STCLRGMSSSARRTRRRGRTGKARTCPSRSSKLPSADPAGSVAPMRTLLALLVVIASANAYADDSPPGETESHRAEKGALGIGLIIGEPTGISAKLYLQDDQATQAAAGSAFIGGGLQVHADYVWHPFILQDRDSF